MDKWSATDDVELCSLIKLVDDRLLQRPIIMQSPGYTSMRILRVLTFSNIYEYLRILKVPTNIKFNIVGRFKAFSANVQNKCTKLNIKN